MNLRNLVKSLIHKVIPKFYLEPIKSGEPNVSTNSTGWVPSQSQTEKPFSLPEISQVKSPFISPEDLLSSLLKKNVLELEKELKNFLPPIMDSTLSPQTDSPLSDIGGILNPYAKYLYPRHSMNSTSFSQTPFGLGHNQMSPTGFSIQVVLIQPSSLPTTTSETSLPTKTEIIKTNLDKSSQKSSGISTNRSEPSHPSDS